jgi:hypothetical protein
VRHNSSSDSGAANTAVQTVHEEHFVDANAAARLLHCSRKHVLKLSIHGLIPAYPLPGSQMRRTWRYLLSELRTWMLNNSSLTKGGQNHQDDRTIGSGSPRKGGC